MINQEFDLNRALGVKIFEEIRLDGMILEKGRTLNEEDIIQLKLSGIPSVFGAIMSETDLTLEAALGIIAAKLCGNNTAYAVSHGGICKIAAVQDGIFLCSDDRVAKFNRYSHNVILNTIAPYSFVTAGEVIAELQITSPVVSQDAVDKIIYSLSGNIELLSVKEQAPKKTALIYTKFYNDAVETAHFTSVVKKLVQDFSLLQLDYANEYNAVHTREEVANAVEKAVADGNEVIFIIPGVKTNDKDDIVPSALNSYVDEIVNYGIPQVDASDLVIAYKRNAKIISLPFKYDTTDSKLVDHYIKLAVINDKIYDYDFARPQNILIGERQGLTEAETEQLVSSENKSLGKDEANIAVVILAAGVGRRAGRNKLLVDVNGKPLFMNAVQAAMQSKASPVFVVTGNQAAEVSEFLEDIDVNIVYNPSYNAGVKTSLNLGLKSVPSFCEGAIILPADMPNITPKFLNKMIAAFKKGQEKQVIMAAHKGIKHNPILWSKALFGVADMVPENADLRPVFMEHEDYSILVNADSSKLLLDITYPSDVEQIADKEEVKI